MSDSSNPNNAPSFPTNADGSPADEAKNSDTQTAMYASGDADMDAYSANADANNKSQPGGDQFEKVAKVAETVLKVAAVALVL